MDIFAHTLWTAAAGIPVRRRLHQPLNLGWLVFWGVIPDIFSFAVPAIVRVWWYATGVTQHLLPGAKSPQHFQFVWQLYYGSHSLITFGIVFGMISLLRKRPVLQLPGWGSHILIDIPTHQGMFALHFLWPVSSFSISVFVGNRWFLAANYIVLLLAYSWLLIEKRRIGQHQMKGSTPKPAPAAEVQST